MKTLLLFILISFSGISFSKEVYEAENCIIYVSIVRNIENIRDSGIDKKTAINMIIESTNQKEVKVVYLKNIDLIYSFTKKGNIYSQSLLNRCLRDGKIQFIEV